jgi:succinyl-CoA synthetase alpha subunit
MGILINEKTKVVVQGITGKQGNYHTELMLKYGTKIVAGVVPNKAGQTVHGVPVYSTIKEAIKAHPIDAAISFVPAPFALNAALEAITNKIKNVVIVTEHLPVKDTINIMSHAQNAKINIIGPNTPGIIVPKKCKIGIMPREVFAPGRIGLVSRSGTLTYEIADNLIHKGFGQSTCVGVGGDEVVGLNFIDVLELFRTDFQTDAVVLIGEIGGNLEEQTAKYISDSKYPKPVVAYVAGRFAPIGKRMGHAGAIISGGMGSAQSKIDAFAKAGVAVAQKPSDVAGLLAKVLA